MTLDKDRIRFKGKVISTALALGGSLSGEGSSQFFEELFDEWKASGEALSTAESWLRQRLRSSFQSLSTPPNWIENEPSWPYLDGKPMVFLGQFSIPTNELSSTYLSPGETVYVFGGRKKDGDTTRMVYTTVTQYANGR